MVTENAYPPLQFVDPASGDAIGWEYDAMAEIAKRINVEVVYENISWDAMIAAVGEGQFDLGMTGSRFARTGPRSWTFPMHTCVRKW